jgi:hypothetical protein
VGGRAVWYRGASWHDPYPHPRPTRGRGGVRGINCACSEIGINCRHYSAIEPLASGIVTAFDRVELAQDRLRPRVDTIANAPLDVADPDRRARQFSGQRVDLDAVHDLGADRGYARLKAHGLAFEIGPEFKVLDALKGEIEEVSRTAAGSRIVTLPSRSMNFERASSTLPRALASALLRFPCA